MTIRFRVLDGNKILEGVVIGHEGILYIVRVDGYPNPLYVHPEQVIL